MKIFNYISKKLENAYKTPICRKFEIINENSKNYKAGNLEELICFLFFTKTIFN